MRFEYFLGGWKEEIEEDLAQSYFDVFCYGSERVRVSMVILKQIF